MFFLAEALLAGLTTALFGGADIRSSNISRGAVVNPEPILSIAGGGEATLDDRHTLGARVWMCNHLTDARDNIMRRCFNEIDPFLYYRNRWPICENGTLMSETGPTWVLSPAFRAPYRSNTEVEWRFRQEWINPYVTPFYYVRWGFHPAVKTYWQTGVKRTFPLCERLMLTPFSWRNGEIGSCLSPNTVRRETDITRAVFRRWTRAYALTTRWETRIRSFSKCRNLHSSTPKRDEPTAAAGPSTIKTTASWSWPAFSSAGEKKSRRRERTTDDFDKMTRSCLKLNF